MVPRSSLPPAERAARAKLTKVASEKPLLKGTLVSMARECGNPRCKCSKGEKHVSLYLSIRVGEARKMIYVPAAWETTIKSWVEAGNEASSLLDEITKSCLGRFLKKKETGENAKGREALEE